MRLANPLTLLVLAIVACGPAHESTQVPASRKSQLVLALKGDVDAMHALCFDFTYGKGGLRQSGEHARLWCAAAAERGSASCQTLYAQLLDEGGVVPWIRKQPHGGTRWLRARVMSTRSSC